MVLVDLCQDKASSRLYVARELHAVTAPVDQVKIEAIGAPYRLTDADIVVHAVGQVHVCECLAERTHGLIVQPGPLHDLHHLAQALGWDHAEFSSRWKRMRSTAV